MKKKSGFSLVELLVGIAIIGILASSTVVAVNPAKRIAQAKDAQRKTDISVITNALIAHEATFGQYPAETGCDSSIGSENNPCPVNHPESTWDSNSFIYIALVGQQVFKQLPIDPKNDHTFHYRYEPYSSGDNPKSKNPCFGTGQVCRYWIGSRLEAPSDPQKPIFRCSDNEELDDGTGCKEVGNWDK